MGSIRDVLVVICFVLTTAFAQEACMKDMLIILDTSYSIGKTNFDRKVKPFLQQLMTDVDLNVSPDGSHIAFLVFSDVPHTKVLLQFGQDYDVTFLNATINGFDWDTISGSHTRTDLAFQKANEIFSDPSPQNHRPQYDDVILLFTDGEPLGVSNTKEEAIAQAKLLKKKNVVIVGVGVGKVNEETLQAISSPGEAHQAKFEDIHTILSRLVAGSCQYRPGGTCQCSALDMGDYFVGSNSLTREVSWDIPVPECNSELMEVALTSTEPDVRPGYSFPIGRQNIKYTYSVNGNPPTEVTCDVSFEVKGVNLCRGKGYSVERQLCCCGFIHEIQNNHMCCGTEYISKVTHKCCPGSTISDLDQSCFGPPCKCAAVDLGTRYINEGESSTTVTWKEPTPSCGGQLHSTSENLKSGQKFGPGSYRVDYLYKTANRLDVTCSLHFEVKACSCPIPALTTINVQPGDTTISVTWRAPLPSCSEAITNTYPPKEKQGESFFIGQHTLIYRYNINNQFDIRCGVIFEVRGALCRDKGYNPSRQICCCGTIHNIVPGFDCCDQDYYNLTTHQCCTNSVVRAKALSCPQQ